MKGRDYYRMIARTAIRLLGLPELAAWIDFVQLRKLGDDWEARLVGEGQPQGWMRTLGVTARVAAEARGPSPADAIRFALEKEPR